MLIEHPEECNGKRPIDTEFYRRASVGTVAELTADGRTLEETYLDERNKLALL